MLTLVDAVACLRAVAAEPWDWSVGSLPQLAASLGGTVRPVVDEIGIELAGGNFLGATCSGEAVRTLTIQAVCDANAPYEVLCDILGPSVGSVRTSEIARTQWNVGVFEMEASVTFEDMVTLSLINPVTTPAAVRLPQPLAVEDMAEQVVARIAALAAHGPMVRNHVELDAWAASFGGRVFVWGDTEVATIDADTAPFSIELSEPGLDRQDREVFIRAEAPVWFCHDLPRRAGQLRDAFNTLSSAVWRRWGTASQDNAHERFWELPGATLHILLSDLHIRWLLTFTDIRPDERFARTDQPASGRG